jgi:hypothetical protein
MNNTITITTLCFNLLCVDFISNIKIGIAKILGKLPFSVFVACTGSILSDGDRRYRVTDLNKRIIKNLNRKVLLVFSLDLMDIFEYCL